MVYCQLWNIGVLVGTSIQRGQPYKSEIQGKSASVVQLRVRLESAKFDLGNCEVKAPADGLVTGVILQNGPKPQMKPVIVRFDDYMRIGFETERNENASFVTVFLPGSPDPWAGNVVLVEVDRLEYLKTDFGTAVATCEQLGRGSAAAFTN